MYLHFEEDEHSEDSQEGKDYGVDDDNYVDEEGPPKPVSYDQRSMDPYVRARMADEIYATYHNNHGIVNRVLVRVANNNR